MVLQEGFVMAKKTRTNGYQPKKGITLDWKNQKPPMGGSSVMSREAAEALDTAIKEAQASLTVNLVVLRVSTLEQSKRFYETIGARFSREQHGTGPEHYAATLSCAVFELYPCGSKAPTSGIRLGFRVASVSQVVARAELIGAKVHTPPTTDAWGKFAVIVDPDGNRVELRQPHH
jgi:lactoylglutathione lyase